MYEIRRPGKKTIRGKLKKHRKRLGDMRVLVPNPQLSSVIGSEPRPREELVERLQTYCQERGLVDAVTRVVHANPELRQVFWGRPKIRQSDLRRVVTYHVELPGRPRTMLFRLAGNATTPTRPRPPRPATTLPGTPTTPRRPKPKP